MGHGVRLMHSRFKVEIQATKLLQVAESSCAVKKSEEEKNNLEHFAHSYCTKSKFGTTDPGFLLNSMLVTIFCQIIITAPTSTSISLNRTS